MIAHLAASSRRRVLPAVGCALGSAAARSTGALFAAPRLPSVRLGSCVRMQSSGLTEDQAAHVRKVMQSVQANVKEGVEALRSIYGDDGLAAKVSEHYCNTYHA